MLAFFEIGCACGVAFALGLVLPARNRLNFGRWVAERSTQILEIVTIDMEL